jgi:hypothetical protein
VPRTASSNLNPALENGYLTPHPAPAGASDVQKWLKNQPQFEIRRGEGARVRITLGPGSQLRLAHQFREIDASLREKVGDIQA